MGSITVERSPFGRHDGTTDGGPVDPCPVVTAACRAMRRIRVEQLVEIGRAAGSGEYLAWGYRSPTDWLVRTTGESVGHCRVTISIARRLPEMPFVAEAFACGEISESALRLFVEVWRPEIAETFARDEELLTAWAKRLPHPDFAMVLETWKRHAAPDGDGLDDGERSLHISSLLDGMGKLDGVLDPASMAIVREALRTLSQPCEGDARTPGQRRADALRTMAQITLEHLPPELGRKRRRPKVIATISWDSLRSGRGGGSIDTGDGRTVVSAEAIRRMACDAGVHRYVTGPDSAPIDFGRSRRAVSDAQFDRLIIRDHGCRLGPGCPIPAAGCEAHHVIHWPDGSETNDDELILGCWYHHRQVHEERWRIEPLGAGHFQVSKPNGERISIRPPLVGLALPAPRLPL